MASFFQQVYKDYKEGYWPPFASWRYERMRHLMAFTESLGFDPTELDNSKFYNEMYSKYFYEMSKIDKESKSGNTPTVA